VRGRALTIKTVRAGFGLWVSARTLSIRRKTFSGFRPSCPHGQCEARSFGSKVNLSYAIGGSQGSQYVTDSASVGTEAGRACLQVTTRMSEVDAVR
jgi:hypothetical protein